MPGQDINDAILAFQRKGLTIVETIRAISAQYGLNLREAKHVVSQHSAWTEVVDATLPLHDDLERLAEQLKTEAKAASD